MIGEKIACVNFIVIYGNYLNVSNLLNISNKISQGVLLIVLCDVLLKKSPEAFLKILRPSKVADIK